MSIRVTVRIVACVLFMLDRIRVHEKSVGLCLFDRLLFGLETVSY